MSNKEKNLTNLADISIDPSISLEYREKKEFTNNIKIDPWAW